MKRMLLITIIGFSLISCKSAVETTPILQADLSSPTSALQTPSATATAAQTLTPAPTVTFTPYPMYFTEEFNSELNGWESFQTGGAGVPKVTTENSQLRIDIASPNTWYYAIQNTHEYSNVTINAKVEGNPSGSIGLVCYYNKEAGWFEFNIASDKTYSVLFGKWLAQDIAQYTPIANDPTDYLIAGSLNNELGLTCQGSTLLLYIDGKLFRKLDVSRFGLTEGKIGITASSFDEIPMAALVDWINVSEK